MVSVSELEQAVLWRLEAGARAARSVAEELAGHGRRVGRASTVFGAVWYGPDADSAVASLRAHRADFEQARVAYGRIDAALSEFAGRVGRAQELLQTAIARADALHATVSDTGAVRVSSQVMASSGDPDGLRRQLSRIADDVDEARTMADAADQHATKALRGTALPDARDVDVTPLLRTVPGDPEQIDAWWDGLSPQQQLALITADPKRIGSLDGVTAIDRDQANRLVLDREREAAAARLGRAQERMREIEELGRQGRGSPQLLAEGLRLKDSVAELTEQVGRIEHFGQALDRVDPTISTERRFLLKFDPAGDGRVVVAVGNPDTADNVATFVPGTEVTMGFDRYVFNKSALMQGDAARLNPRASTSVITWLDYEAPSFLRSGDPTPYVKEPSASSALGLARFQSGLRAAHVGPPSHNTVMGHSYGGTTVGYVADRVGLDVDNLVFVAAPGSGQGLGGDVGDFRPGLTQDGRRRVPRVFATVADNDPIKLVSGIGSGAELPMPFPMPVEFSTNGPDPAEPGFGATVFRSDPGVERSNAVHESYWDGHNNPAADQMLAGYDAPGKLNTFRDNAARIVTGRGSDVTPVPPRRWTRIVY